MMWNEKKNKKNIKKIIIKIKYRQTRKIPHKNNNTNNTHLHTTTTSAVIEVKTANSFNLFTITKYNNNKILSNRQDRLRYKNKIKSSSIITKI